MVGEIITTVGGGAGLALVAKYGFEALKVHLVTRNAKSADMPQIANAVFRHAGSTSPDAAPAPEATAPDDAPQDVDEADEDGDEQRDPPPRS